MSQYPRVPVDQGPGWVRQVASAINYLLGRTRLPFEQLTAAPADPAEGTTYYDLTLHKVRTFDGTAWQDHF